MSSGMFGAFGNSSLSLSFKNVFMKSTNIGNARTGGWTTPVLTDSITTVAYQPTWYVPASAAWTMGMDQVCPVGW